MRGIKIEMKKRKSVVRIQRQKTQVPCSPLPCGAVSLFVCCCCCCCPLPLSLVFVFPWRWRTVSSMVQVESHETELTGVVEKGGSGNKLRG